MPGDAQFVYWDSNVLLSYINAVADRVAIIDELFKQARAGEIELITSSISRVDREFHTYCEHLHKWSGVLGFPVTEPQTAQGVLDVTGEDRPTESG